MKAISSNKYQVSFTSKDHKKINGTSQTQIQTQRIVDAKKIENQHTKRIKIGSTIIPQDSSKIKIKKTRSPQIIKLMIQELQKQLQQKIKPLAKDHINHNTISQKSLKSTANSEIMKIKRKVKNQNPNNQKSLSKICPNYVKSPNKLKKSKKNSAKQNSCQLLSPRNHKNSVNTSTNRPLTAKKTQKKKRTKVNLTFNNSSNNENQMSKRKVQREDFLVLGDQFVDLKNISAITQFQFSDGEEKSNTNKIRQNTYQNMHGRWSSDFENLPKQVERSFFQQQKSTSHQIQNNEQLDQYENLIQMDQDEETQLQLKQTQEKNKNKEVLNSITLIQRWWRKQLKNKEEKSKYDQNQKQNELKKNIKQTTIIIQDSKKDTQQQIPGRQKVLSKSQKNIQTHHEDILKLRQNAANLQFKTHQQILIELLQTKKITQKDFQEKNELISKNLQRQLKEIQSIKDILKESAKKVEDIMKKTREDIKIIQKLSETKSHKEPLNQNFTQPQTFLTTLFGQPVRKTSSHSSHRSGSSSQYTRKQKGRYQKVKLNFDNQIQQFLEEDENEHKNKSGGICNSPSKSLSQQSIESQQQEGQRITFDQDDDSMQAQIYSGRINQSPSCHTTINPLQSQNLQQLYKQFQTQEQIKKQLELRVAKQLGMISESMQNQQGKVGINTSIIGIHKFLINFFKFYLYYHKADFLKFINMPFGQSIQTRLKKNKHQQSRVALLSHWQEQIVYTQDDEQVIYGLRTVIPKQVIEQFYQSYYQETDIEFSDVEKTNIQLEKIHNRAIFDSFNENLNEFRPYFCINGPPYIWTNSEKALTFYFISQQNIQEVYEKTQMKVLKMASYLCGLSTSKDHKKCVTYDKKQKRAQKNQSQEINSPFKLLENQSCEFDKCKNTTFQQYLYTYTQNFHSAYFSNLQDRLSKKQSIQVVQQNKEWFDNRFQQQKVNTLIDLSSFVQEMIILQYASQMLLKKQ